LNEIQPGCVEFTFDLGDIANIEKHYLKITRLMNGIDILVNNAAIQCRGRADEIAVEDFEHIMKINVTAPYVLAQCFARERIKKELAGSLIMIASVMSEASRPTISPYVTTKGAIRQMIKALAIDWAPFNIRVNGIGPGYIETDMTRSLFENREFAAWVKKRTPLSRWGNPTDLEGASVFLASEASAFVTGQVLYVDGGWLSTF